MNITRPVPYRGEVITAETAVQIINCAACGVIFGIGAEFMRRRREDHQNFYCPNGDPNVFQGESPTERRARLAEDELKWVKARADSWKDQALAAERSRRAQKAQTTKLKNRIAAGVCPCCHRSFQNVARHMAGQHPDYTAEQS